MASEEILKELLQVAKSSHSFKGMSEEEIWKACQTYRPRPDNDIKTAIENIHKKDQEIDSESAEKAKQLEAGKEKIAALHQQEIKDRKEDDRTAENLLAKLFN